MPVDIRAGKPGGIRLRAGGHNRLPLGTAHPAALRPGPTWQDLQLTPAGGQRPRRRLAGRPTSPTSPDLAGDGHPPWPTYR